jgi:hypothetical protein
MIQYTKKTGAFGGEYIEAIDGDKLMQIPIEPGNTDYQAYLKSLENADKS